MQNQKRIVGRRKHYCGASFKQEASLKGSLIGGAESQGLILNIDSGKKIDTETLQVKFKIMKQAVTSSPRINLECMGREMALLLDSGSMVSVVQQSYFDQNIKPKLGPARGLEPPCTICLIFKVQWKWHPHTRSFEMDVAFLGFKVPKVGFLIVKDPSDLLETKKKTKLPGIIRWSLIKLVYQEFVKKHPIEVFSSFQCPQKCRSIAVLTAVCVLLYRH